MAGKKTGGKADKGFIILSGKVVENLPSATFKVRLENG